MRARPRALKAASLSWLTKAESLLPIAQGYEVTHERARLWGLLWVRGGRKSLLSAWDEVLRERAQTFGSRLVAREEGKSATAFVLFLFEKIHNFDCAVTIFTQKH